MAARIAKRMTHPFWTYFAIIAISVVVAVNPLTYTLIESDEWWVKWIWRIYLAAINVYLVLLVVAVLCYLRGIGRPFRLIALGLIAGFIPFLFVVEVGLFRYKFEARQAEIHAGGSFDYLVPDTLLSWRNKEASVTKVGGPDGGSAEYRIDADGAREIAAPRDPKKRIFFYGDSMLFAPYVNNDESALSVLAEELAPHYQVTNYAVDAYGLPQFLGRLMATQDQIAPGDAVVFGPISEDLERNLVMKEMPCGIFFEAQRENKDGLTYPVFEGGKLRSVLLEEQCDLYIDHLSFKSFLPFGRLYTALRFANLEDRMLQHADAIFATARDIVERRGAHFHIIFLSRAEECLAQEYLIDIAQLRAEYRAIARHCPTSPGAIERLSFTTDYHYSVEGNRWAAAALEAELRDLGVVGSP